MAALQRQDSPHVVIDIQYLEACMSGNSDTFLSHSTTTAAVSIDAEAPKVAPSFGADDAAPMQIDLADASACLRLHRTAGTFLGADLGLGQERTLQMVEGVEEGSLADNAGVSAGDILLNANGAALQSTRDVLDVIGGTAGTICLQGLGGSTTVLAKPDVGTPLGLTVAPVAPVIVTNVEPHGLAEQAGLRIGDQLLSINGVFCETAREAADLVAACVGTLGLEVRCPRPRGRPLVLGASGRSKRRIAGARVEHFQQGHSKAHTAASLYS